jgi:uncharacterized protein YgiM (DUF1202 family)
MTGFIARFSAAITAVAILTACGSQTQQAAKDQSKPAGAQPAPPAAKPAPSPAPATAQPKPTAPPPAAPTQPEAAKPPADAPQALVVRVGRANLRERPDTKARIIHVLNKGTRVTVVSKGNQWYRVRLADGTEGWLAESVVTPASP